MIYNFVHPFILKARDSEIYYPNDNIPNSSLKSVYNMKQYECRDRFLTETNSTTYEHSFFGDMA